MKLTIESTDFITVFDGVPVRIWRGTTEGGHPVDVFVHRMASDDPAAQFELNMALREQAPPAEATSASMTLDDQTIEKLTRDQVEANRGQRRDSRAQAALDRAAEAAVDENLIHAASAILILSALIGAGGTRFAHQVLWEAILSIRSRGG